MRGRRRLLHAHQASLITMMFEKFCRCFKRHQNIDRHQTTGSAVGSSLQFAAAVRATQEGSVRHLGLIAAMALVLLGCQHAQQQTATQALPLLAPMDVLPAPSGEDPLKEAFLTTAVDPTPLMARTLWDQLRHGFALDHQLQKDAVQHELAWFRRNPAYFERRAERLQRYLPTILATVEAKGFPAELALMPIVESALDPYAFSPGGAAGLWQFIPATADRFKLRRNYWYEERRDVQASTDAALSYLSYLKRRFEDWELAVAAYNAGEGNVGRALRKLKARGALPQQPFWTAPLPAETRRYVPRILAMAAVITEPERYGVRLPELSPEPDLQQVLLPGQMDLARVASVTELDLDTLYQLNPALNQWATPPDGPHLLYVPASLNAEALTERLAAVPKNERVAWERILVKGGDTLSTLARRHRIDQASIRRSNGLTGDRIRVGQTLFIPKSAQAAERYPITRRIAGRTHKVQAGDSLWSIAERYNVRIDQLVRWNELHPKTPLKVGSRLSISPSKRSVVRNVRYKVRQGDSLYAIAKRFETSASAIAAVNGIQKDDLLRPGQQLKLEVNVKRAPAISAGE